MACECIFTMDAKLAEHNTRLSLTFMFPRDGSEAFDQITIGTEKLNTRNRTKVSALATFCPFCGTRYVPLAAQPAPTATEA